MSFIPVISQETNAVVAAQALLESQLLNIFNVVEDTLLSSESLTANEVDNYTCCGRYLDINSQIPYWVVLEKEEKGGESLSIFDFIQKYYDWLYCDEVCGGSDYLLEDKLLDIIDIEKTKESYRKRLYYTYFPEYRDEEDISIGGVIISDETIAKFVKGIKIKFYVKKGSLESLKIFFKSLFSLEDVLIRYPKKQILRLNAGAFFNPNFNFLGSTANQGLTLENIENEIVGSYLSHSIIQDGDITGNAATATTATTTSGNAATATSAATLTTARAINGVNFDGSAPITVTADAGTLSGTALNTTVLVIFLLASFI